MKRLIKISSLLIVALLLLALGIVSALADSSCETTERNIASLATVVPVDLDPATDGDQFNRWPTTNGLHNLNDGSYITGTVSDHRDNKIHFALNFEDTYEFTKIAITTVSAGRMETSYVASSYASNVYKSFVLKIDLIDETGAIVHTQSQTTSADGPTEFIIPESAGAACRVEVSFPHSGWGYAVWEVETFSKDAHDWQQTAITTKPGCETTGIRTMTCSKCGDVKDSIVPATGHTDTCKGECDICHTVLEVAHTPAYSCSPICTKCGKDDLSTSGSHVANELDPCDTACVNCHVAGTVTPTHVPDGRNPCNNNCVKCGAVDVIPSAYDIPQIYATSTYKPYTYAKHVANPNDPCDTTCFSCKKTNAVKAAHVPNPTNPCGDSKCNNANCYSNKADYTGEPVFRTVVRGTTDDFPHVRADIGNASRPSCKIWCAECGKANSIPYAHEFDNCGDATCNICLGTINQAERAHVFTATSAVVCVDCGYTPVLCLSHTYDNNCDVYCNNCNYQRYGRQDGTLSIQYWHLYDNSCDTECNDCKSIRTITHTYSAEYECAQLCTVCGEAPRQTETPHTYSNLKDSNGEDIADSAVCDTTCDVCGETREVTHKYARPCSPVCSWCLSTNPNAANNHTYDNDCDPTCNNVGCNVTRPIVHKYDHDCDPSCSTVGCTAPDREITHQFTSDCDPDCNNEQCGFTRSVAGHKYSNNCDAVCDVKDCGYIRTTDTDPNYIAGHLYDNACDTTCNTEGCKFTRAVADHVYDNDCDNTCNECNQKTRDNAHTFADWTTTTEPTKKEKGEKTRFCLVCNLAEKQEIPAEGGLGTGAIIGIVAGAVAVVGGGGFCLWWFVLKKKFLG